MSKMRVTIGSGRWGYLSPDRPQPFSSLAASVMVDFPVLNLPLAGKRSRQSDSHTPEPILSELRSGDPIISSLFYNDSFVRFPVVPALDSVGLLRAIARSVAIEPFVGEA
jgi:hypothetical protein